MTITCSPAESTDTALANMHREIAWLQAVYASSTASEQMEVKQRLNFLLWKQESLSVVYNWKRVKQ